MHLNQTQRVSLLLIITLLALYQAVSATPLLPMPRNMVNDSAHLYTPAETERLETLLRNYRGSTGRDIVVVTVRDLRGHEVNEFTTRLGNDWGVGQRGVNNGLIFLLVPSRMPAYELPPEAHERSEQWLALGTDSARLNRLPDLLKHFVTLTNERWKEGRPAGYYGEGYIATGRGMEGALPDILAMRIMRDIVTPYAAAHRYAEGTEAGVYAIMTVVAGDASSLSALQSEATHSSEGWRIVAWLLLGVVGYVAAGYGVGLLIVLLQSLGYLFRYWGSKKLQRQYRLGQYWRQETKQSARRVLRRVPSILWDIFTFLLASVLRGRSSGSGGSSGRGRYSGGGGSFGGGGGGSRF